MKIQRYGGIQMISLFVLSIENSSSKSKVERLYNA